MASSSEPESVTVSVDAVLLGHSDYITSLDHILKNDEVTVVSGCADRTIRVWTVKPTALPNEGKTSSLELLGHTGGIRCVRISDTMIFSGSDDGTCKAWDYQSGNSECILTYEGHSDWITAIEYGRFQDKAKDPILLTASSDATIRLWDIGSGFCSLVFRGHTSSISSLAMDTITGKVYSGSYDMTVREWDLATGECLRTFASFHNAIRCLLLRNDQLFCGLDDGAIEVLDVSTDSSSIVTLRGHTAHVKFLHFSEYGHDLLYSGSADGHIIGWDIVRHQSIKKIHCNATDLNIIGHYFYLGSADGRIRVCDADATRRELKSNMPQMPLTPSAHVISHASGDKVHAVSTSLPKTLAAQRHLLEHENALTDEQRVAIEREEQANGDNLQHSPPVLRGHEVLSLTSRDMSYRTLTGRGQGDFAPALKLITDDIVTLQDGISKDRKAREKLEEISKKSIENLGKLETVLQTTKLELKDSISKEASKLATALEELKNESDTARKERKDLESRIDGNEENTSRLHESLNSANENIEGLRDAAKVVEDVIFETKEEIQMLKNWFEKGEEMPPWLYKATQDLSDKVSDLANRTMEEVANAKEVARTHLQAASESVIAEAKARLGVEIIQKQIQGDYVAFRRSCEQEMTRIDQEMQSLMEMDRGAVFQHKIDDAIRVAQQRLRVELEERTNALEQGMKRVDGRVDTNVLRLESLEELLEKRVDKCWKGVVSIQEDLADLREVINAESEARSKIDAKRREFEDQIVSSYKQLAMDAEAMRTREDGLESEDRRLDTEYSERCSDLNQRLESENDRATVAEKDLSDRINAEVEFRSKFEDLTRIHMSQQARQNSHFEMEAEKLKAACDQERIDRELDTKLVREALYNAETRLVQEINDAMDESKRERDRLESQLSEEEKALRDLANLVDDKIAGVISEAEKQFDLIVGNEAQASNKFSIIDNDLSVKSAKISSNSDAIRTNADDIVLLKEAVSTLQSELTDTKAKLADEKEARGHLETLVSEMLEQCSLIIRGQREVVSLVGYSNKVAATKAVVKR